MNGFERLSALDATFLEVETRASPMGIGAVCIFEAGTMLGPHGNLAIERVRAHIAAAIEKLPRYRQRIAHTPLLGHPVWIEDEAFNLDFHIRHVRLPHPGDDRQLLRLAGRLFSQQMDRTHPLWELWCVDGLAPVPATDHGPADGGRFAIIAKVHHCMSDGVAVVGLLQALLGDAANPAEPKIAAHAPWQSAYTPTPAELLLGEIHHRNRHTLSLLGYGRRKNENGARSKKRSRVAKAASNARAIAGGIVEILRAVVQRRTRTPLTPNHISAFRRFDTLQVPLADAKRVSSALGGTINDVMLAIVTSSLRSFLLHRGVAPTTMGPLRAMIPVDLREGAQADGNKLGMVLVDLPIHEIDPRRRYQGVRDAMEHLKHHSNQIAATSFVTAVANAASPRVLSKIFHLAIQMRSFDVVVTNVRGPGQPMYLGDAKLAALYPMVPLYERQAVGVAIFSYDGTLHLGISAAWDLVPDLHDLVMELPLAMAELTDLIRRSRGDPERGQFCKSDGQRAATKIGELFAQAATNLTNACHMPKTPTGRQGSQLRFYVQ
jgi:diacylglycerol O-acyltransferase / wax synthase